MTNKINILHVQEWIHTTPKNLEISDHASLNLHHTLQILSIAELQNDITHAPRKRYRQLCYNLIFFINK